MYMALRLGLPNIGIEGKIGINVHTHNYNLSCVQKNKHRGFSLFDLKHALTGGLCHNSRSTAVKGSAYHG